MCEPEQTSIFCLGPCDSPTIKIWEEKVIRDESQDNHDPRLSAGPVSAWRDYTVTESYGITQQGTQVHLSVGFEELHNPGTLCAPPTEWGSNISTKEIEDLIQSESSQDYLGVIWEPHFGNNIWLPSGGSLSAPGVPENFQVELEAFKHSCFKMLEPFTFTLWLLWNLMSNPIIEFTIF